MKSIAVLLSGLFCSYSLQQDAYGQLQQLNGTWKMQTPKGPIYESWQKAGNNEMRGGSYKLNGKDTIIFEDVRLIKSSGDVFFVPVLKDQNEGKPVSFKMISSEANTFIFENKEHDFPQRIIYHLVNIDSLHAWIEGSQNGKEERADYYFKRIR